MGPIWGQSIGHIAAKGETTTHERWSYPQPVHCISQTGMITAIATADCAVLYNRRERKKSMLVSLRPILGVALALGVAGCSAAGRPVRQKGVVTLEGQPLAGFTVT